MILRKYDGAKEVKMKLLNMYMYIYTYIYIYEDLDASVHVMHGPTKTKRARIHFQVDDVVTRYIL